MIVPRKERKPGLVSDVFPMISRPFPIDNSNGIRSPRHPPYLSSTNHLLQTRLHLNLGARTTPGTRNMQWNYRTIKLSIDLEKGR